MLSHEDSERIRQAKSRFDADLHTAEYARVHSDRDHLESLLARVRIDSGGSCLDLGTGNGYLALELARRRPDLSVRGLDIAELSMSRNRELAASEGLSNADFLAYDGTRFPFGDGSFDGVLCRYSFHHYPRPVDSLSEIRRVLSPRGFFLLADPRSNEEDEGGFIDELQRLKPDGHVHYYSRTEIEDLAAAGGFQVESEFSSSIRYPRPLDPRYEELFSQTEARILELYKIERVEGNVWLTLSVMNLLFRKR